MGPTVSKFPNTELFNFSLLRPVGTLNRRRKSGDQIPFFAKTYSTVPSFSCPAFRCRWSCLVVRTTKDSRALARTQHQVKNADVWQRIVTDLSCRRALDFAG
eukprot:scaffold2917_cov191-Amphora_coffeaeformis.AAC.30